MTRLPCQRCAGTGWVETPDEPCETAIRVGHETIGCWAQDRAHGQPGQDPHMALLCEPCPSCGGYDEHVASCPDGETTSSVQFWFAWHDEASTLTLVDDAIGSGWYDRHMSTVRGAR